MRHKKYLRLYCVNNISNNQIIISNYSDIHYLINVMRLKIGDKFLMFNAREGEYLFLITSITKNKLEVENVGLIRNYKQEKKINLIFSPLKQHRMLYLFEKATELGVTTLTPVLTKHSVVDKLNYEKCNLYVKEAAEQCMRLSVPEIKPLMKLEQFIQNWNSETIFFCNENEKERSFSAESKDFPLNILIGPEGGFSEDEQQFLQKLDFIRSVHLGDLILRAETAAVFALALANS